MMLQTALPTVLARVVYRSRNGVTIDSVEPLRLTESQFHAVLAEGAYEHCGYVLKSLRFPRASGSPVLEMVPVRLH